MRGLVGSFLSDSTKCSSASAGSLRCSCRSPISRWAVGSPGSIASTDTYASSAPAVSPRARRISPRVYRWRVSSRPSATASSESRRGFGEVAVLVQQLGGELVPNFRRPRGIFETPPKSRLRLFRVSVAGMADAQVRVGLPPLRASPILPLRKPGRPPGSARACPAYSPGTWRPRCAVGCRRRSPAPARRRLAPGCILRRRRLRGRHL